MSVFRFNGSVRGLAVPLTGLPKSMTLPSMGPTLTPVALNARLVASGHSIVDQVMDWPWSGVPTAAGQTPNVWSGCGPYASADFRWNNDPAAPDKVRELMENPAFPVDIFIGIEAGDYFAGSTRTTVQQHIVYSDAYGYALLWHNLAASRGAQTFYMSFPCNDPSETFGSGWRADLDVEGPRWDGIIDDVNANRDGGTPAMRLIPLVHVFAAIYDAIQAGTITGMTIADCYVDDIHFSTDIGLWIEMCSILYVAFQRDPDEMPNSVPLEFSGTVTIDSGLAAQLRPVIRAACESATRSGLV